MASSKVLPRLLRLRELEEEQSRAELEASVGVRNRAAAELDRAIQRQNQGRVAFASAIERQNSAERTAATLVLGQVLGQRIEAEEVFAVAESEVELRRDAFLLKRMSRQQVETLVEKQVAQAREQTSRRAQQMLDDWYGRKTPRKGTGMQPPLNESAPMKFS
jgi:flagellar export protein FliJ